jgi:hypothetical protein
MPRTRKHVVRKRGIHLHFCVDEEERRLIGERMAMTGVVSLGAYLRKMAIDGYFITIDLSDLKELIRLLRNATNNMNQIAKRANETRSIYEADIADLRARYDELWNKAEDILRALAELKV